MISGNFVQADVVLLPLGDVRVGRPWRQSDDERLGELDGVSANAVVLRVQQGQNVALHLSHQVPAGLLALGHSFGADQPLTGRTEGVGVKDWNSLPKECLLFFPKFGFTCRVTL